MNFGIIGLPRSGKTTTFHLLTGTEADPSGDYKREVIRMVTHVPDDRVDRLAGITGSKNKAYITVEYVDTPGLEQGSSKTDWFSSAIVGGLKNSDALLHVVGCFETEGCDISGLLKGIRQVEDELMLADLVITEKRQDKLARQRKVKKLSPEEQIESDLLESGRVHLEEGRPLRTLPLDEAGKKLFRGFQFLSEKPVLAVINISEAFLQKAANAIDELNTALSDSGIRAMVLSAVLEGEIAALEEEEREAFLKDLGVTELARDRVIRAGFEQMDLLTFLTTNEKESHAWPLRKGGTAQEAAGVIHTDMAKGFIRAEVVSFEEFVAEGGYAGCRSKGILRSEGRGYEVKDGDVLLIRHS